MWTLWSPGSDFRDERVSQLVPLARASCQSGKGGERDTLGLIDLMLFMGDLAVDVVERHLEVFGDAAVSDGVTSPAVLSEGLNTCRTELVDREEPGDPVVRSHPGRIASSGYSSGRGGVGGFVASCHYHSSCAERGKRRLRQQMAAGS
ncbi:hypothetical protein BWQ96_08549 [Gracilariopsis chorda]|uniref:Uncharacterized protein n=1 Tax=Gracilariopsis chorda TaxID=448386 RepID=A0A2V3IKV6_9FLOR|nr:hypothetical protein BWQ96_08549 [Gracilariopsis chorda]|eukprot:PXF41760.1 hypothetical protein BWQ96_08549 [Gracilariopsis chorda]